MRIQHEAAVQKQIVEYIRAVLPRSIVAAIPNGSQRTASGRPANAVAGLLPGMPDLVVVLPEGKVLWAEIKSDKGRVSPAQLNVHGQLNSLGHVCVVLRSVEDTRAAFKHLNIKTRESGENDVWKKNPILDTTDC
jgi:hypothetical protein